MLVPYTFREDGIGCVIKKKKKGEATASLLLV